MADNTTLNLGTGGDIIATDELTTLNGGAVSLIKVQRVKVGFGSDNVLRDVDAANGLPVVGTFWQATQPVSGPITDTQLRATAVPVSALSLPLPTGATTEVTLAGIRTDLGTDGTTPPAILGTGTGVRGWLRSIYEKLTGTIAVTGTFWQTTQPVSGTFFQVTQPVSLATAPVTPITDNNGSLTVDAPVAAPVFVRLSDGVSAVTPLTSTDLTAGTARGQPFDIQSNQAAMISLLRHAVTSESMRIYGDSFADGIGAGEEDAGAFPATATVTGSATGTVASGQLVMTTGATTASTGSLQAVAVLPMVTGSVAQSTNGMTFPSANLTAFRVVSRRAGVDTVVESSAFSVVPTPITNAGTAGALAGSLVNGVLHRCEIFYQGNTAVFTIDGNAVHRMSGNIASPRTDSLDFPTFYEWSNTATPTATLRAGQYNATNGYFFECQYNVANVTMACRGTSSSRIGGGPRIQKVSVESATLHVTATAAVNTAITATLPAPAAGLFHYVTSIELTKLYSVLGVAAGAGVIITSTNLPGTPAWTTEQAAGAVGTATVVIKYIPATPFKSAVAATATTFVAPAQLQTIWRWNISYFTAA